MKNTQPINSAVADCTYRRIAQAIRYLAGNFRDNPPLARIAEEANLSPFHFQRVFRRWVGVSPHQFARHLALESFKGNLRRGGATMLSAFDAGISGPSRAHELLVSFDAVTPAEYRRQGEGMTIQFGVHLTPFGDALIASTARGICALRFIEEEEGGAGLADEIAREWPKAKVIRNDDAAASYIAAIFPAHYKPKNNFPTLHIRGTNFQINVWRALLAIAPGTTASYRAVAEFIGNPKAVRAVGGAVARNPIAWLIPCHRVIGEGGDLTGYRWGFARKRAMLGLEFAQAEKERGHPLMQNTQGQNQIAL